jgi:predicted dehydrogenase
MKLCVIGVGRMGRRHVTAARSAGFEIAGVFDLSAEALASTRAECNVDAALTFGDAAAMLKAVRPDAIVVSTTAPSHGEFVCAAAEGGVRYILCEKPMATSVAECDRMIAACRAAGAKLAVNHQRRFME